MILHMNGDEKSGWSLGETTAFADGPAHEMVSSFSPDGRWIAFMSAETGQIDVYVRPFPRGPGQWQISSGGGSHPTWSRTRRELYFAKGGQIMVVPYSVEQDRFVASTAAPWSSAQFAVTVPEFNSGIRGFDLHPDGERVALSKAAPTESNRDRLIFVFNFFDELRQIAPVTKR